MKRLGFMKGYYIHNSLLKTSIIFPIISSFCLRICLIYAIHSYSSFIIHDHMNVEHLFNIEALLILVHIPFNNFRFAIQ